MRSFLKAGTIGPAVGRENIASFVGTRYTYSANNAADFFLLCVLQYRGSAPRGPRQLMGTARDGLLEIDEGLSKEWGEGLVLGVSFQGTR